MSGVLDFRRLRRILVVPAIALFIPFAGCVGFGESESSPTGECFGSGDRSRPARAPALVALLDANRLLRISLPGGAVEAERRVGPALAAGLSTTVTVHVSRPRRDPRW